MPDNLMIYVKNILHLVNELKDVEDRIERIKQKLGTKSAGDKVLLKGYKNKALALLKAIENENSKIFNVIGVRSLEEIKSRVLPKPQIVLPKPKIVPVIATAEGEGLQKPSGVELITPEFKSARFKLLGKKEKEEYTKSLGISYAELEDFVKAQRKVSIKEKTGRKIDYSIYRPSGFGKIANKYVKKWADAAAECYPKFFEPMFRHFQMVDIEVLSRTYISVMIFFTIISFPALLLFFTVVNLAFKFNFLLVVFASLFGTIATFFGFYFYPASLISSRKTKIKRDLPFALVHMGAVAGSGANPISIFELLAESEEYPELKKEIKKVLNQVNLFGYNLGTALKNVAKTTPSPELKELFEGMVSTIETGGDLKGYLREKAEDAMRTYKLDRKKQVEALAAFSEVYTAILIAAPLLLIVTLAIINSIGGQLGGLSISTIAWLGVGVLMPVLNIGFMLFISASQKGM